MDVSEKVTMTLRAQEHGHQPIVCFAPDGNHCGAYLESKTSATLQTRYHYGSGGDAVLIMEKRDKDVRCAAFMGGQGSEARSIAWNMNGTAPTLKASQSGSNQVPDVVYEVKDG